MPENFELLRLERIRQQLSDHRLLEEGNAVVRDTDTELRRIVKEYLKNDPELHKLVDKISQQAEEALTMLGSNDHQAVASNKSSLESLAGCRKSSKNSKTSEFDIHRFPPLTHPATSNTLLKDSPYDVRQSPLSYKYP